MLSQNQQLAASHLYGPMMVVAGPGSGKTRVLTERVKNLCRVCAPERICVITFARKAAEEMRSRFAVMTDEETAQKVCFGTFHSVFLSWLKRWQVLAPTSIVEPEEDVESRGNRSNGSAAVFMCSRDEAGLESIDGKRPKTFGFQDILDMMESVVDLYAPWEEYDFFLIDEFQDIDPQQYRIVYHMVGAAEGRSPNLFVVGDEDQSIYGFRGSDPSLFLRFAEDYPQCKRVDLTVNYRSHPLIVSLSRRLIEHNLQRFRKEIMADPSRDRFSLTSPVRIKRYFDDRAEVRGIADLIGRETLFHSAVIQRDTSIAVLSRTHRQGMLVAEALEEAGVAYSSPETWVSEHPQAVLVKREMNVLMSFILDGGVSDQLFDIFPVLYRAGHRNRIPNGTDLIDGLLKQETISTEERGELEELHEVFSTIREMAEAEERESPKLLRRVLLIVLFRTGYFSGAMARIKQNEGSVFDLLRQIKQIFWPSPNPVRLMTMHGAKGLEFDHVYVTGLTEGSCPREEAEAEGAMEEERRLMYVAMTRAKSRLTLSYYDGLGSVRSRFLDEMLEE
ncbi:MAG: ATP-dependent helicase [Firmicutes bacterium]|nr:ATP-dependent helicase [Bacillota bacterium]